MGVNEFETLKSEVPSPVEMHCSFQDSYISSEHCYQKPRTYYPAVERRLVVETRCGSELEDSLRSTEDLLEMAEQRYGTQLDHEQHKLQLADRSFSKVSYKQLVNFSAKCTLQERSLLASVHLKTHSYVLLVHTVHNQSENSCCNIVRIKMLSNQFENLLK